MRLRIRRISIAVAIAVAVPTAVVASVSLAVGPLYAMTLVTPFMAANRPVAVQAFSAARVRATSALSRSPLPLRLNTLVARNWERHAGLTLK